MAESIEKYISSEIISELLKLREDGNLYHRESQTLEFKESFNFNNLHQIKLTKYTSI